MEVHNPSIIRQIARRNFLPAQCLEEDIKRVDFQGVALWILDYKFV